MDIYWWVVPVFFLGLFLNAYREELSKTRYGWLAGPFILFYKVAVFLLVIGIVISFFTIESDTTSNWIDNF